MKGLRLTGLLCFFLSAVLLFCSCASASDTDVSSNHSEDENNVNTGGSLELLYSATDSLSPYAAVTKINNEAALLMFDPLIKLDNNFNPVNVLANSISQLEDLKITVELKSALFTDGSALTAEDVVFSFDTAKASQTKYAYQLNYVVSCTAISSNKVEFTFTKNDPYAVNLLDFPIIKKGSENRTDDDNVALPPIGCGRYYFDPENERLVANEQYHSGKAAVEYIRLINSPDTEAVDHNISVGAADIYYTDLSDEDIVRMSGKRTSVNLNNLVYLGVNMSPGSKMANVNLRYAVSAAISRQKIADDAYYSNAMPATGIFNPAFKPSSQYQTLQKTADQQIVVVNLSEIGYNNFDSEGYAINSKGNRIKLSILVNEESSYKKLAADIIADQLCDAGISASVTAVPFTEYKARLERQEFDLYLAETMILNNMDITEIVSASGSAAYGIYYQPNDTQSSDTISSQTQSSGDTEPVDSDLGTNNDISCEQIIQSFYKGECDIGSVATIFESQLPVIPVVYKTGILFYSDKIQTEPAASISDIFFSIEEFTLSNQ